MPLNIVGTLGSTPFALPITVTGVAATTISAYAASGTVNGANYTITFTTSGAHGLAALLSAASNITASGGTNSGASWAAYDWTIGTPGSSTAGTGSLPNAARLNQMPGFPWLGVTIASDATVTIIQGSWLVTSVPSSTTFTINVTSAVYALFTGALAGTPAVTPFLVPGAGNYLAQLGANCTLLRGATTNAAGTALSAGLYVPGAVNAVTTGAAVSGQTPGTVVPFYNSGVPLGGTVTAVVHATGNATTVCVPISTDGTVWQMNPIGAGTSRLYKYL